MEAAGLPGAIRCDNGPEFTSLYFIGVVLGIGASQLHLHTTGQTGAERSRGEFQRKIPG